MTAGALAAGAPPVFRFAPSPNGQMHLGHALSALTGYEMAQRLGGRFLVRIEDIDTTRARPQFVAAIFEDLQWLGILWETPVLIQSEHFAEYAKAAATLRGLGLLYPCFATRAEIAAAAGQVTDPDGVPLDPGIWKLRDPKDVSAALARGEPYALRLDMDKALRLVRERLAGAPLIFTETGEDGTTATLAAEPERWGDAVIVRKEFAASYNLAVVVDDARQGVSHVTRGQDLFAATGLQRLLQILLGFPEPVYHHHRLILGADGRKLSKSSGDTSLASLRSHGARPGDIRRLAGLPEMP